MPADQGAEGVEDVPPVPAVPVPLNLEPTETRTLGCIAAHRVISEPDAYSLPELVPSAAA
jgi:hypothetical protein